MKNKTIDFDFTLKAMQDEEEGTFEGYGSKFFNIDRARDIIIPETFAKSLTKRKPALLWQHNSKEPIGVFDEVSINQEGLYVRGRLSKKGKGSEAHDLLKMGALNGMSVGYITKADETDSHGITTITEAELLEISLVTFPCNEEAIVIGVKSSPDFSDFPIDFEMEFDPENQKFEKDHFLQITGKEEETPVCSYAFALEVNGKVHALWNAILKAAGQILSSKKIDGSFDPALKDVIDHINKYYKKAGKDSPFRKECGIIGLDELKEMSLRSIEKSLANGVEFSKKAAKALVSGYRDDDQETQRDAENLVENIKKLTETIRNK